MFSIIDHCCKGRCYSIVCAIKKSGQSDFRFFKQLGRSMNKIVKIKDQKKGFA